MGFRLRSLVQCIDDQNGKYGLTAGRWYVVLASADSKCIVFPYTHNPEVESRHWTQVWIPCELFIAGMDLYPGLPVGWRIVRFGVPKIGERYISSRGAILRMAHEFHEITTAVRCVVEKVCSRFPEPGVSTPSIPSEGLSNADDPRQTAAVYDVFVDRDRASGNSEGMCTGSSVDDGSGVVVPDSDGRHSCDVSDSVLDNQSADGNGSGVRDPMAEVTDVVDQSSVQSVDAAGIGIQDVNVQLYDGKIAAYQFMCRQWQK